LHNAQLTPPPRAGQSPPLIPILVGNLSPEQEATYGKILAPYLNDPTSVFIASSDFCHWGSRFNYTYYLPGSNTKEAQTLRTNGKTPTSPAIHDSIAAVDHMCVDAVETGIHQEFIDIVAKTGNTVCGRHPIGVVMAAMEVLGQGKFKFVKYDRSSLVESVKDSSVSYCSAYAVV
jgi:AmmeMemoRadiSam system protein B